MDRDQFQDVCFESNVQPQGSEDLLSGEISQPCRLLTQKEEADMLYSIRLNVNSENLLDLSCEQEPTREPINISSSPKYWQFVEDRVVDVGSPITISDGYITSYKLYKVKTKKNGADSFDTCVERRYSDFECLHQQLLEKYGGWLIPRLPDKNIWANLDMETHECKQYRKAGLQKYLNRLMAHSKIKYLQDLRLFLFDKDHTFSEQKGEFSSQNNYEEALKKMTTNVYESGVAFLSKYMNREEDKVQSLEAVRLPVTKDDNEITHFLFLVNGLTNNIKELKEIVYNTVAEVDTIKSFNSICNELTQDNYQCKIKSDAFEDLVEEYEEIFDFIDSCKEALERRNRVRAQLEELKIQENSVMNRNRHNPRNITLDMIRAEIRRVGKKYRQWTSELLGELESEINLGKSMLTQFIGKLEAARRSVYCIQ